jgi:hypothetical protein
MQQEREHRARRSAALAVVGMPAYRGPPRSDSPDSTLSEAERMELAERLEQVVSLARRHRKQAALLLILMEFHKQDLENKEN